MYGEYQTLLVVQHPCFLFIAVHSSIIPRLKMVSNSMNKYIITSVNYSVLMETLNSVQHKHWEEVPFGNFQLELDLCDEVYAFSEQQGYARFYVIHHEGVFVGYMSVVAAEMLHHKDTVNAITDSFYIVPEHRSAGAFKALLEHVEQDIHNEGNRFFTVGINPNMPNPTEMQAYLVQLGYIATEISMTKEVS